MGALAFIGFFAWRVQADAEQMKQRLDKEWGLSGRGVSLKYWTDGKHNACVIILKLPGVVIGQQAGVVMQPMVVVAQPMVVQEEQAGGGGQAVSPEAGDLHGGRGGAMSAKQMLLAEQK